MSQLVYDLVTGHIVLALARGVVPWRKPWSGSAATPVNAVSKRSYRGINILLLGLAPYEDNRWVTFRQAAELGGSVKRGAKSSIAVFYKHLEPKEGEDPDRYRSSAPLLRFYHLFNAEQCENLRLPPKQPAPSKGPTRIEEAEALARAMPDPPALTVSRQGAWYRPSDDVVGVPPRGSFVSADAYYATLFHELGHSTGHHRRLGRPEVAGTIQFGSESYGQEELVAELTSAYLCAVLGLDNSLLENAASYIDGWLNALKRDNRAILTASSKAQKASDYIRGLTAGDLAAQP